MEVSAMNRSTTLHKLANESDRIACHPWETVRTKCGMDVMFKETTAIPEWMLPCCKAPETSSEELASFIRNIAIVGDWIAQLDRARGPNHKVLGTWRLCENRVG